MGATTTLMFSSPELPGGPNAASGSATALLDLEQTAFTQSRAYANAPRKRLS